MPEHQASGIASRSDAEHFGKHVHEIGIETITNQEIVFIGDGHGFGTYLINTSPRC